MMFDQLGARPIDRILEIGAGTGLLHSWPNSSAGPAKVTTVDIDAKMTGQARGALDAEPDKAECT